MPEKTYNLIISQFLHSKLFREAMEVGKECKPDSFKDFYNKNFKEPKEPKEESEINFYESLKEFCDKKDKEYHEHAYKLINKELP